MSTIAFYPGSFDPVTLGHLDVIARISRLFSTVVVAIGTHHAKSALFPEPVRRALLEPSLRDIEATIGTKIVLTSFDGLMVEAAREHGASVIVRGLRNGTDFIYEAQMEGMNRALAPEIDVLYLAASPSVRHIASSLVKQIAALGGEVDAFVPPHVAQKLKAHYTR